MSRILLADIASHNCGGKSIGHYYSVASNYVNLISCVIAGGPIYLYKFDKENIYLLPYDTKTEENVFKKKVKQLLNCHTLFKNTVGDTVILQHAALATAIIGIVLFKKKHTKLFLITYNDEGNNTIFKRFWYRLAKRKIEGIICPYENIGKNYDVPFCVVSDYIYSGNDNKIQYCDYEDKSYDFCVVGRLAYEKGVIEVAKKFVNTNYRVLIAGKPQTQDIADELFAICNGAKNIILKLEYISEKEYYNFIQISRYCILNYKGGYSERSSGVVLDILFNGTPVVGNKCKALGFIEEYGVGCLFDDIFSFNFSYLLNRACYKKYLEKINAYKKIQSQCGNKLKEFIEL